MARFNRVALLLFVGVFMLLLPGRAFANGGGTFPADGIQTSVGNTNIDSGQVGVWYFAPHTDGSYITDVYLDWSIQSGDEWGFVYWEYDTNGTPIEINRSTAVPTISTALSASHGVFHFSALNQGHQIDGITLWLHSGSSTGGRYVAFDNAVDSLGTTWTFATFTPSVNTTPVDSTNWAATPVPSGQQAPSLLPFNPYVPIVPSQSVRSSQDPGGISANNPISPSGVGATPARDSGGNAVAVPVPTFSQPSPIESPSAPPIAPNPGDSMATTPKQPGLTPQAPLTKSVPDAPTARMFPSAPLTQTNSGLTKSSTYTRQAPDSAQTYTRKTWSKQTWTRSPVPTITNP